MAAKKKRKTVAGAPAPETRRKKQAPRSGGKQPLGPRERAFVLDALRARYPDARCTLDFTTPLELLVATILSAQCTDARVNAVTPALFEKYTTAKQFAEAPQQEIEHLVRSTGFYSNKAKAIRGACARIESDFGGRVPETMAELLTLSGVARKTASVVLGNAFGRSEGIVVDTHVSRVSQRLQLTLCHDPRKIEADLMKIVPHEQWTAFAHQMIQHGRTLCTARKPQCDGCPLAPVCPSVDRDSRQK